MAVTTRKLAPDNGAAKHFFTDLIITAVSLTALPIRVRQLPVSFLVESVQLWATAVTDAVTTLVGIVDPGRAIQAISLGIAGTADRFKITVAFDAVMPLRVGTALNAIVHKAITDNLEFSTAFTINVAAAAGQFWGVVRIQMDAAGVISTKVPSANQVFTTEAYALTQVPAADPGSFDLGTITIRSAAGAAFLANTTALNAGGTTVNYNGKAAGFRNVCSANPSFVAATQVQGAMQAKVADRAVTVPGGLLVVELTTTGGSGAATDAVLDTGWRPYPLDGEVPGF